MRQLLEKSDEKGIDMSKLFINFKTAFEYSMQTMSYSDTRRIVHTHLSFICLILQLYFFMSLYYSFLEITYIQ